MAAVLDVDLAVELWEAFAIGIPAKEKFDMAEKFIGICDEAGFDTHDFKELIGHDKVLADAYSAFTEDDEDDYDEDEDYDEWD